MASLSPTFRPVAAAPHGDTRRSGWIAANAWQLAALALLSAWLFNVGSTHEVWGDESQAWLLARESTLGQLLFDRVRYEGTPALWHVILWIAARSGLQLDDLFLISSAFALAGACVVLWRAPFPAWARLGIVFGYFFSYQYSVVARSYSVDLLLIPLAAAWFSGRMDRPWRYALCLGLLANLNAFSFIAAAILGAELLWRVVSERRHDKSLIAALSTLVFMGLVAVATAWQPSDNGFIRSDAETHVVSNMVRFVREAFIDKLMIFSSGPNWGFNELAGSILTIIVLRPVAGLIWSERRLRIPLTAIFALLVGFSGLVYSSPWHSGVLFLLAMFAVWILWPFADAQRRRQFGYAFALVAAVHVVEGAMSGYWDIGHTYSPAKTVAAELQRRQAADPDIKIAAFGFRAFEVQPYLPGNPYANYNAGAAFPQYVEWHSGQPWRSELSEKAWSKALAGDPDLIVASLTRFRGRTRWLDARGCRAGYRAVKIFPAVTIWRGGFYEDASLALYARAPTGACPRIRRWRA